MPNSILMQRVQSVIDTLSILSPIYIRILRKPADDVRTILRGYLVKGNFIACSYGYTDKVVHIGTYKPVSVLRDLEAELRAIPEVTVVADKSDYLYHYFTLSWAADPQTETL